LRISAYLRLAVCAALLIASLGSVDAATVQVSSNLQAAVDAASPGDVLLVSPGTYGKVEIAKRLSLIGSKGAVIRAGERDACVSVLASDVEISGFTVLGGFYGIALDSVQGCKVSNNTVLHCAQPGIMLKFSDGNLVEHNNASFNGLGGEGWYGIYLSNSNNNTIRYNVAANNGAYGINLFPSCNNNTIIGNVLERNMYGLYMFTDCADNLVQYNTMSRNTNSGMDIRFGCHDNLILNNTIESNAVAGITLMDSGKNTIKGNLISSNQRYGVQIQGDSGANAVVSNEISSSQTGIFLDASGNLVYGNRMLENVVGAEDRGTNFWSADYPTGGNLWSDYFGKDEMGGPGQDQAGSDSFGDTPYQIGSSSQDRYPIVSGQVMPISIADKSISPDVVKSGDSVLVRANIWSKYGLSQVSARVVNSTGAEVSGGYVRMVQSGDMYEGSLVTALIDPGSYGISVSARDRRGYELEERIGEVEIRSRGSWDFNSSISS